MYPGLKAVRRRTEALETFKSLSQFENCADQTLTPIIERIERRVVRPFNLFVFLGAVLFADRQSMACYTQSTSKMLRF